MPDHESIYINQLKLKESLPENEEKDTFFHTVQKKDDISKRISFTNLFKNFFRYITKEYIKTSNSIDLKKENDLLVVNVTENELKNKNINEDNPNLEFTPALEKKLYRITNFPEVFAKYIKKKNFNEVLIGKDINLLLFDNPQLDATLKKETINLKELPLEFFSKPKEHDYTIEYTGKYLIILVQGPGGPGGKGGDAGKNNGIPDKNIGIIPKGGDGGNGGIGGKFIITTTYFVKGQKLKIIIGAAGLPGGNGGNGGEGLYGKADTDSLGPKGGDGGPGFSWGDITYENELISQKYKDEKNSFFIEIGVGKKGSDGKPINSKDADGSPGDEALITKFYNDDDKNKYFPKGIEIGKGGNGGNGHKSKAGSEGFGGTGGKGGNGGAGEHTRIIINNEKKFTTEESESFNLLSGKGGKGGKGGIIIYTIADGTTIQYLVKKGKDGANGKNGEGITYNTLISYFANIKGTDEEASLFFGTGNDIWNFIKKEERPKVPIVNLNPLIYNDTTIEVAFNLYDLLSEKGKIFYDEEGKPFREEGKTFGEITANPTEAFAKSYKGILEKRGGLAIIKYLGM